MLPSARMLVCAALATLTLGACSDTAASGDADAAVGTYTLVTIDGQPLPVVVDQSGADMLEITQGTVVLDADRTFDDSTVLRTTLAGVVSTETDAASGNWTLSGRTVAFTPNDQSGPYEMTWDGNNQLTQDFSGLILVYQRH